ncbi:MAG: FKBP-type peptidyl-prolyl cis-trans isomerase [Bacteroidales bacterium]|jgi:FKBP-type peptidyl-prolyl cis-trans isomerase|nr:FKBP-type peptidyl-prolyl cis-trans isomerase [Bacteroidales bacterium]
MKRISLVITVLCTVGVLFATCGDKRFKGYEKTDTGLYYKFKERNPEGQQPQIGDFLYMVVSYYSDNDSIPKFEDSEITDVLTESLFKGDIYEAYAMLKEGETADFIIKADSFFYTMGGQIPSFISPNDVLFFTIRMNDVKTIADMHTEEEEAIENYIYENNITVEPTASGLIYLETEKGKGAKVENGKTISVHYTGKFLDGQVFDSSVQRGEPISFVVGTDPMITGFIEGVLLMNQGGKATLLLPSDIAYGQSHPSYPIPPYTPLLFEVEIVDVK